MTDQAQPSVSERSELARLFRWLFSWRGIRSLLIVLAWTATLMALLYGEENWRGRRAWNKYRQELEARGEQLDYKAFIPKPVPDEQNFAATALIDSWFIKRTARWEDDFSRAVLHLPSRAKNDRSSRGFLDLPGWEIAFSAIRPGELKAPQKLESNKPGPELWAKAAPAVLEDLKKSEAYLEELRTASRRPHCRYPVIYDLENPWGILIPHLASVKEACQRLQIRACAELAAGQSEQALEDVKLMLYLADSLKEEPFLISYLVRLAGLHIAIQPLWEGLAEHRWSEAQLQELQKRFQPYNFLADMNRPLSSERAAGILTVDLIKKKGLGLLVTIAGPGSPTPSDRQIANLGGLLIPCGWYYLEKANYCRLYQMQLGGAFDPNTRRVSPSRIASNAHDFEGEIADGRLGKGFGTFIHHCYIASLLLPSLGKVPLKAAMAQTAADQALLACALERYRLANGQFPEKLEALVPRFMPQLPHDVLTGEPYKYRRSEETGFVLFSIGWDEQDGGGVPGRTLWDEKQGDWVWQYPANSRR